MYHGIAVQVICLAIFDVALYCGLTVINCRDFWNSYLLKILAFVCFDILKSQTVRPLIYRL
jgi:hypothetical protein